MATYAIRPYFLERLSKDRKGAAAIIRLHRLKLADVAVSDTRFTVEFDGITADESRDFDRAIGGDNKARLFVACPPQFMHLFVGPEWPAEVDAATRVEYEKWLKANDAPDAWPKAETV